MDNNQSKKRKNTSSSGQPSQSHRDNPHGPKVFYQHSKKRKNGSSSGHQVSHSHERRPPFVPRSHGNAQHGSRDNVQHGSKVFYPNLIKKNNISSHGHLPPKASEHRPPFVPRPRDNTLHGPEIFYQHSKFLPTGQPVGRTHVADNSRIERAEPTISEAEMMKSSVPKGHSLLKPVNPRITNIIPFIHCNKVTSSVTEAEKSCHDQPTSSAVANAPDVSESSLDRQPTLEELENAFNSFTDVKPAIQVVKKEPLPLVDEPHSSTPTISSPDSNVCFDISGNASTTTNFETNIEAFKTTSNEKEIRNIKLLELDDFLKKAIERRCFALDYIKSLTTSLNHAYIELEMLNSEIDQAYIKKFDLLKE